VHRYHGTMYKSQGLSAKSVDREREKNGKVHRREKIQLRNREGFAHWEQLIAERLTTLRTKPWICGHSFIEESVDILTHGEAMEIV
jgi:hypothetical protein